MIKSFRAVGFAVAAIASLGLFACNQPDKITAPEGNRNLTGKGGAHVRLPSIPAEYLAKSAAGSQAQALFALTIYGGGMAPMHQSWVLTPGQAQSAYISGIPAGKRVFHGRLMKMDTAFGDTTLTHEGSDTAWIERDSITDVNLFLRKVAGSGSAHVCVEVEGWASDSTCVKPPVPPYPRFKGCWNLSVLKKGSTPNLDTVFKAKLRIEQWDSTAFGVVTWNSGVQDSAWGRIRGNTILLEDGNISGQFTLKASLDTMVVDTLNPIELRGTFFSMGRNIYGIATGSRAPCDTVIYPPIDTVVAPGIDSSTCWSVWQTLSAGETHTGTLSLVRTKNGTRGAFRWKGFPEMRVTNDKMPSLGETLYLYGNLPKGMPAAPGDTLKRAHYKAKSTPFSLDFGNVYATSKPGEFTAADQIGTWYGKSIPCKEVVPGDSLAYPVAR